MITPGMIYLIGILDSINTCLSGLLAASTTVFIISFVFFPFVLECGNKQHNKTLKKFLITVAIFFVVLSIAKTFLPSTKLAAAMYVVPAIANNEDVKAIGGNSIEALRKLTEQWLLELNGKKTACGHEHNL